MTRLQRLFSHPQAPLLAFFLIFLTTAAAFAAVSRSINHSIHRIDQNQRSGQRAERRIVQVQNEQTNTIYVSCHASNIVRASDNQSHYADWVLWNKTIQLFEFGLKHPTRPLSAKQRQRNVDFIQSMRDEANSKTWIDLTNCRAVSHKPLPFRTPKIHHFSTTHPAPRASFHVDTAKGE